MNKKLAKFRQITVLFMLVIFVQNTVSVPVAKASVFSPVIPYLTASFKLFSLNSEEESESKLTILQGNFLAASNSPKKSEISSNSKSLGTKVKELIIPISAYSSTPDQTDDSPFITARGTYVRDGIIAANFLPFGTKIKIPEIFGDKIFVVEDRMNSRYWHKIDIWFPDRQSALEFGVKTAKIQIIES
jgi:3D (Asp-Asp-Asp) domain-containing protein